MRQQISLREANHHLSTYVDAVEKGHEVVITRRGRPVARLLPYTRSERLTAAQEAAWKRTLARLRKGYRLGGAAPSRESLHDR